MPRSRAGAHALLAVVAALTLVGVLQGAHLLSDAQGVHPSIHLKYASFDPLLASPVLAPELADAEAEGLGYHMVQFVGPIESSWREAIEAAGGRILDYVPDYAYLVAMDNKVRDKVERLPEVRWVGPYHPAYKLSSSLRDSSPYPQVVDIQVLAGEPLQPLMNSLKSLGAEIQAAQSGALASYVRAALLPSALVEVARLPAVGWVEPYAPPEAANDIGRSILAVGDVWDRLGLYGAGQIVAVCDTGLDSGNAGTLHADLGGRLLKAYALGRPPDDWSDPQGHGTHVAGSILGSGILSGARPAFRVYEDSFAGVAPQARLVFQSVRGADGTFGTGIPNDLNQLFLPPYRDGARVHNNSWSGPTGGDDNPYGGYVSGSRQVDEFTWSHKDMVILAAAGNHATDANEDGVVDSDAMPWPGTAKNMITVGATESVRSSGGYDRDWDDAWPKDYPVRPIQGDHISNDARGIAAFSGRGPTDDGRIKPDLVAPGTNIVSTRSQEGESTGWGVYDDDYLYMGGTSMASPLVSGAAALVRERYVTYERINPSAALVKATLINGAEDISPGQYPVGPCQEIPATHPNNVSGWGRVNLTASVAPIYPNWILFKDQAMGLETAQVATYTIQLSASPSSQGLTRMGDISHLSPLSQEPAPPQASPHGCQESLSDNSFELGIGWETEGDVWLSEYAHSGEYSAWMGGLDDAEDWLWQTMNIPRDASRVTLSFWYAQDSDEPKCGYDYFWIGFYDQGWDEYLTELLWQDGRATTTGWKRKEITLRQDQLDAIKGQTVHLAFELVTDYAGPTTVRIDDVSLKVCTGAENAAPKPLRVTLVWTDYPGSLSAAKALVNDLDLEVISPSGARYFGNGRAQADRLNTVEDLILLEPSGGRYTIRVRGTNVPFGPQPFALVVSGGSSVMGVRHLSHLPMLMGQR